MNKSKEILSSAIALLAIAVLAGMVPAYAQLTGPLGGTCAAVGTGPGTPVAIETATFTTTDGTNVITYLVEVECFVTGATATGLIGSSTVTVTFNVEAACTTGTCPGSATLGSIVIPSANSCNNPKPGAPELCVIDSATAPGGTVTIGASGAFDGAVPILTATADLLSFPTHGRNTVATFGQVSISAGSPFNDVFPDFSIVWFNSGK